MCVCVCVCVRERDKTQMKIPTAEGSCNLENHTLQTERNGLVMLDPASYCQGMQSLYSKVK